MSAQASAVSTATRQTGRDRRLLRFWQQGSSRKPRLWFELLLIAVSYGAYSMIRNAVPTQENAAQRHARSVWSFEQQLGIAVERTINHTIDKVEWLIVGMNYYYATLHFVVTLAVLIWVYRRHPLHFTAARTVLLVATGIALVGFALYPLAPPRLMIDGGFIDTIPAHHTWGSMGSPSTASVSNQFAAMPSMHFGWSLWCGLTLAFFTRHRWVKIVGLLYPLATLIVIVATANHFWLDAVGGALCVAVGGGAAALIYRRPRRNRVFTDPENPGKDAGQQHTPVTLSRPADDERDDKLPARLSA